MVTLDPKATKWALAVLVISLAVNVFVAGMFLGHALHRERGGPEFSEVRPRPEGEHSMRAFVDRMASAIPGDDRGKFLSVIDGYKGELTQAEAKLRESRGKVRDAIAAEPFDRSALETAFGDVRARMQDVQKILHGALADAVSHLPPDSRKALANWNKAELGQAGPPGAPRPPGPPGSPDR